MAKAAQLEQVVEEEREESLIFLNVREAFDNAGGDYELAIDNLIERCKKNRELMEEVMENRLANVCRDLMQVHIHRVRDFIWRGEVSEEEASIQQDYSKDYRKNLIRSHKSVLILAKSNEALFDFPLPLKGNVKKLGDANREEVLQAAGFYLSHARDNQRKATWLTMIAKKLKGEKTVREVLKGDDLKRMQNEVQ